MNRISTRVESLSPSQTLAMSQKSAELKASGVDVINLSVGEPDFNTPEHIKEAAKRAIDDNFTFYTPVPGYMSLRKAIAANLKDTDGVDFAPEQIVVSNGAKSRRRSHHPYSRMGKLCGDGQAGRRHQRARACRHRAGLQDHPETA